MQVQRKFLGVLGLWMGLLIGSKADFRDGGFVKQKPSDVVCRTGFTVRLPSWIPEWLVGTDTSIRTKSFFVILSS
jgi:hypothetical protein